MSDILLDLGFFKIHWYSFLMLLAVLIGSFVFVKETRKQGIANDIATHFLLWLIPLAIIGARLYFVIFNWNYYSTDPVAIFKIWEGGMAIHGAIIAGLLYSIAFCFKYKIKYLRLLDMALIGVILGQMIGRWGNFFNQEAYGGATTLANLQALPIPQFIIDGMYINGTYYHPTFFYETVWCLIGFIILLVLRKNKYLKLGFLSAIYLIWYGLGRFMIEGLRTDSLMLGDIKMAQVVSLIMILAGVLIIFFAYYRKGRFDNLYQISEGDKRINEV